MSYQTKKNYINKFVLLLFSLFTTLIISTLLLSATSNHIVPTDANQSLFAGGTSHSLVLIGNDLWAFGENINGQLGDGTAENSLVPISIGEYDSWKSVVAGNLFSIGLKTDGTLWGWGRNNFGQLGLGIGSQDINLSPVQIGTDSDWVSISAGSFHVLALRDDGTLWAWGRNNWGQIGNGESGTIIHEPLQIGIDSDWARVVAGGDTSYALKNDGTLWSWGSNEFGQRGRTENGWRPGQIGSFDDWQTIAAGNTHVLALRNDGTLWSWGSNHFGELGNGTNDNQNFPELVNNEFDWKAVTAGTDFTIALKDDGTLWSFGRNRSGQLGTGTFINSNIPVIVIGDNEWISVAAGHEHVIALKDDGSIWTFGLNHNGQLGNNSLNNSYLPIMIFGTPLYQTTGDPISHTFPSATIGYARQETNTFTVTNSGNQVTGTLNITISDDNFVLSTSTLANINPFDYRTFTVRPADDLAVGIHEATITVAGRNGIETVFSISFTVNPLRNVTVNYGTGSGSFTPGDLVSITADSAVSGFRFSEWKINQGDVILDDFSATSTTFLMPDFDIVITAIFVPIRSDITVQSNENGTASADVYNALYGSVVTLTATPDYGFRFKEWQVLEGNITIIDNQFVMSDSDVIIEAVFEPILHFITVENDNNGTALANFSQAAYQTLVTLSYEANSGFRFKEWQVLEGNVTITDNQFTMPNASVIIKAIFEASTFSVTVNNDGNGIASSDVTQAEYGTTVTLNATPNTGYRFKEWQVLEGNVTITDNQFTMPNASVIIKAIFEASTFSVTVNNDGNGIALADVAQAEYGTTVTLSATPNTGYRFKEWQIIEGSITINSYYQFNMPESNVIIQAIFERIPFSIRTLNDGNGTLSANLSNATFGTIIVLTITPDDGYRFLRFEVIEGDITISDNQFVMPTENVVIRAIFEPSPSTFPWRNVSFAVGLTLLGVIAAFLVVRTVRKRK